MNYNRGISFLSPLCALIATLILSSAHPAGAGQAQVEKISPRMLSIINRHIEIIEKWAAEPVIVAAAKEQNAQEKSLAEIRAIDREWLLGGQRQFAADLQNNRAGRFLKEKVLANSRVYSEAFLCDRQGAVVGEYPKTSDYWQGDEEKFTGSFNMGLGQVFQGPLMFDESTKTYSVQVSVPVRDHVETIGVLIVGIRNI